MRTGRCSVVVAALVVDRKGLLMPALAGLLAGAASSSSLLTATVGPVLLLWILIHNRAGLRMAKLAAFLAGSGYGVVVMARHGLAARKTGVPFGPFLALGGAVGLMLGPELVDWYTRHLT